MYIWRLPVCLDQTEGPLANFGEELFLELYPKILDIKDSTKVQNLQKYTRKKRN